MIKELTYETNKGQRGTLLAQEKTVQYLFQNRYEDYLRYRLQQDDVRLIQTRKYVRTKPMLLALETRKESLKAVTPEERDMIQAEQIMTKKKAMDVLIKYTDKKRRTQ